MNARVETVLFSAIAILFAAVTLSSLTHLAFAGAPWIGEEARLHAAASKIGPVATRPS
jgi:hypothetical protein